MNQKLSPLTRYLTLAASLALVAVIFLPLWQIELSAPQYPEGLNLIIYPHKLGGQVDVVNGLNHYIGMRTLHTEDFVEFTILPYIIGTFAVFGLLTFMINRKWFYTVWVGLFLIFAVISMVDFYRWEYNYGHNLDPTAPIRVPGMSYQPPLIGYKQLLNFGAYSIPAAGGWIFVVVGVALFVCLIMELRRSVTISRKLELKTKVFTIILLFSITSCSTDPQAIKSGSDACHFCKMTITQVNFGSEWITEKGRVYKFDDTHCLIGYLKANPKEEKGQVWFADFAKSGKFVPSDKALLLESENLKSPMGGNTAAFSTAEDQNRFLDQFKGKKLTWQDIKP